MDGAETSETSQFNHAGLEARETLAVGEVFPLDIPVYRTFPQPRRLLGINLNRTFHLLLKPDILICYQQFLGRLQLQWSGITDRKSVV